MARSNLWLAAAFTGSAFVAFPTAQPQPAAGHERLDYATIARIRDEGLHRSEVMDHLGWLADVYGPRLTGSPAIHQASDWALKRFAGWGLVNGHREEWPFGKGWSLVRYSAHLLEPQVQPLIGYPKSWTPGTNGVVTADVVKVAIESDADFARYRGQLRGRIVLTQPAREVAMLEGPIVLRMTPRLLEEAGTTPIPAEARPPAARPAGPSLQQRLQQFLQDEGVVAILDRGGDAYIVNGGSDLSWQTQRTDGGTVFVGPGGPRDERAGTGLPQVTLAVEHYNRLVRILDKGVPVKVELDVETRFYDETGMNGFNTLAELPGTDLAREIVMIGAHFDSTHAATGATDNAAGSAAMMEALRILSVLGIKPRRTIRIALWGGEEEGLLGSRAYVRRHFGDPDTMQLLPEHETLAAYFNIDNGTGRIRGVWLQDNLAVRPIFQQWIAPLEDLGVTTLGPRSVGGTDHLSFDAVGLPGFQFIQDRLEYQARTHHSNMDVYDRLQRDDMVQMATVAAVFAYDAAMRDEKLPRKALPKPRK
jgi:carboxypeptidase Q